VRPRLIAATTTACALALAACTSGADTASVPDRQPGPTSSTTTTAPVPTTTTTVPEQPGWATASTTHSGIAVDVQTFPQPDGSTVTVGRFLVGHVRYSLHIGTQDPPTGETQIAPDSGPSVSAAEAPSVVACFNGGFMTNAGTGGFEVDGNVLVPLLNGMGSMVIDGAGNATVGSWGQGVPFPNENVSAVRQNLPLLVANSQLSSDINNIADWGSTLGGVAAPARSGLGEDAQGDLMFAGSMSALPVDIANALLSAGAVNAMELDINPMWIMLNLASTPGAGMTTAVPGQNRPSDQCYQGWTRDFVVVLAT
jgi:hypothetical protein